MKIKDPEVVAAINTALFGYAKTLQVAGISETETVATFLACACALADESENPEVMRWFVERLRKNADVMEAGKVFEC